MTTQREIYEAVVARGYREGWTAEQFAARQVAKLTEELGELLHHVHQLGYADSAFEWSLRNSAIQARREFDDLLSWETAAIESPQDAMSELADIVVVACCLAEALGEFDYDSAGDLMEMALEKATADVARGVRSLEDGG